MQQGDFHMQSPNKQKATPKSWTLNERNVMPAQSSWEIKVGPSKLDELVQKQNVEKKYNSRMEKSWADLFQRDRSETRTQRLPESSADDRTNPVPQKIINLAHFAPIRCTAVFDAKRNTQMPDKTP